MKSSVSTQVKGNIDVLMASETKIHNSFPVGNFVIDEFSTLIGQIPTAVKVASRCTLEKIFLIVLPRTKKRHKEILCCTKSV